MLNITIAHVFEHPWMKYHTSLNNAIQTQEPIKQTHSMPKNQ